MEPLNSSFQRGRNWLLLIAINDYAIKPLNNCVKDAEAVRKTLLERYFFEEATIRALFDHDATRSNIHTIFRDLIKKEIGENDNIIIYYSGHGIIDDVTEAFCWVPIEAENGNESLYVTKDEIVAFLNKIKARHIFLIADSCFSGTMLDSTRSTIDLVEGTEDPILRFEAESSRWGLSSGRRELVSDGKPGEHSPFAKSLIAILNENNVPLRVGTLAEQIIYIVPNVEKAAQTPRFERLEVKGHAGGQMVLHPRVPLEKAPAAQSPALLPDILANLPIHVDIGYPEQPFKGLRWFEKSDARIFFGRKAAIRDLFQLLDNRHDPRKRLILLCGPSGTGKSSLLFAGLLPRLPRQWQADYKRRGQDGSALDILQNFAAEESAPKSVLILDQLEEIFSNPGTHATAEVSHFSKMLTGLLDKTPGLSVILSFREEYLGRIHNLLDQPPDSYTTFLINHLDKISIREALTGVANEASIHYRGLAYEDPDLPLEMTDDFCSLEAKTYTPLIQYVLRRMWDEGIRQAKENASVRFTRELYGKMRRVSLQELLDTQLTEVGKTFREALENGLLNDLLYFFVTEDITACAHPLSDIEDAYKHLPVGHLSSICQTLENGYLLSSFTDASGVLQYRLCHDALAQFVMRRFKGSEAVGQQARRLLEMAIRTNIDLNEEATFKVEQGRLGMKNFSREEEEIFTHGLEQLNHQILPIKINWIEKARQSSMAVCRIVLPNGLGTGFMIEGNYLLTAHHVLGSKEAAEKTLVEFNYELDLFGKIKSVVQYKLDASTFISSPIDALNFSMVKIVDQLEKPLAQWGYLELESNKAPLPGETVSIIQHAMGADKQITSLDTEVIALQDNFLYYTPSTQGGSSGAPVFNQDWKVIAIHRARKMYNQGGFMINGVKKSASQGVYIKSVLQYINALKKENPDANPI